MTLPIAITTERLYPNKTGPVLRMGSLEARLAQTQQEIETIQKLRYQIFYEECGAKASPEITFNKRDFDKTDNICEHLLVIDHDKGIIVGTYRLMLSKSDKEQVQFYTANEFDISKLVSYPGKVMELGRSCVSKKYRNRPTLQLLWKWLANYIHLQNVEICFGCASFTGTELEPYKDELSYLFYNHLAPIELRSKALPNLYKKMDLCRPENIDKKSTLRKLPPLIKGYLRLGGFIGDGAVIDHQFNTIDVCIIVKRSLMKPRYSQFLNLN